MKPEHKAELIEAELTEDDLLSFVAGEATPALKKRIAEEMEKAGSFSQKWLSRVQSAAADLFNIDWAALLKPGDSAETAEAKGTSPTIAYTANVTRTNPACFVFMVDQSSSMQELFAGQVDNHKSEGVALAINRLIQNLILKSAKPDCIRDYFHIGVIGYGARVESALGGGLVGQTLVPISAFANNPLRIEQRKRKVDDGHGEIREVEFKFPVWVEPKAAGRTPMCEALGLAKQYVEKFLGRYPDSYPPLIINITDGMATDGDPFPVAREVQQLASSDGNVLLFNAHLSANQALAVEFPSVDSCLPDNFAKLLFRMSSKLPPGLFEAARAEKCPIQPEARGFVFDAGLVSMIHFLDIGTRMSQSAR